MRTATVAHWQAALPGSAIAAALAGERCPHCGEEASVEIAEIWGEHEFQIEACCECAQDEALEVLREPQAGAQLLRALGAEQIMGSELRRVSDDGMGLLLLDWKLAACEVTQRQAKAFVRAHHAHAPRPPAGWHFGGGVRNGRTLMGVVMVGRPVARLLCRHTTAEANRVCVRRDLGEGLRRNACSMLYGYAARQAERLGFSRIVTYTLEEEEGAALRAAGWVNEGLRPGGRWSRAGRSRDDTHDTGPKWRWTKALRPPARARRAPPQALEPQQDLFALAA